MVEKNKLKVGSILKMTIKKLMCNNTVNMYNCYNNAQHHTEGLKIKTLAHDQYFEAWSQQIDVYSWLNQK